MPLTISHAAAALPVHALSRGQLPLVALMIGSMSPDFAYFLPGDLSRMSTHNVTGVFAFCWPLGLVLWMFYTRLIERPTLALLPDAWRSRFPPSKPVSMRSLLMVSVGVILGAFTHVIWDSFTHANTPVTHSLPFFHNIVYSGSHHRLRLYGLLQHLSTLVGLMVLAYWAAKLLLHRKPARQFAHEPLPPVTNTDRLFAILFLSGTTCLLALAYHGLNPTYDVAGQLFYLAIGGMTGIALGWTLIAISIGNRARVHRRAIRPGAE